eukprot:IDg23117t1
MTDTWVDREAKNLMEFTSDTALASPTHLRQILSFSGVRAPIAVIPTDDRTKVLVCAADSALDDVQTSCEHFVAVSHTSRRNPPIMQFKKIADPAAVTDNSNAARNLLFAIRNEVERLEKGTCTWRPKRFFAARLRGLEKSFHARCAHFEGNGVPPPLAPAMQANKSLKRSRSSGSAMEVTENNEPSRQ